MSLAATLPTNHPIVNEITLLQLHCAFTLIMVGIIWFVQVVHYPLMAAVGQEGFCEYSEAHQSRTSWVVAGPMILEALTAVALVWSRPTLLHSAWFLLTLACLVSIWASTVFLQMPIHARLSQGFDETLIQQLVRTNWIRTWAWSARAIILVAILLRQHLLS